MRKCLIRLSQVFPNHFLEETMGETAKREHGVLARRLSRREFGRMAALLTADSALPFYNEAALAQDLKAIGNIPADVIRLHTNERPANERPAILPMVAQ